MPTKRVLLVDDHAFFRDGVRALVESDGGFTVVGEASTGAHAIELHVALKPDLVVLDMQMPDMGGFEIMVRIRDVAATARFVILTSSSTPGLAQRAAQAGAEGVVQKEAARRELLPALRDALQGEKPSRAVAGTEMTVLTHRERDVMRLVASGHANRAVAAVLGISEETVKSHLAKIRLKLGSSDRAQSVAIALSLHEIPWPSGVAPARGSNGPQGGAQGEC